jgi:hypothetical protein
MKKKKENKKGERRNKSERERMERETAPRVHPQHTFLRHKRSSRLSARDFPSRWHFNGEGAALPRAKVSALRAWSQAKGEGGRRIADRLKAFKQKVM